MGRIGWILIACAIIGAGFVLGWRYGGVEKPEAGRNIKVYGGQGVARPLDDSPVLKELRGCLEEGGERRGALQVPPMFGNHLTFEVEAERAIEFRWLVDGKPVLDYGLDWADRSFRTWDPPAPGKYLVRVEARSARGGGKVAALEKPLVVKPMHFFEFKADVRSEPDRCLVGDTVYFEVEAEVPDRASEIEYEYRYSVNGKARKHPDDGKEWTVEEEFPFDFTEAGSYEIKVEGRRAGQTGPEETAVLHYRACECVILHFIVGPEKQSEVGTAVTLDCFPDSNADAVEYRFTVRPSTAGAGETALPDSKGQAWGREYKRVWLPKTAGQYALKVEVRNAGTEKPQDSETVDYLVLDRGF